MFEHQSKNTGADTITSHDGCGAAKIYCQAKGLDIDQTDQIVADLLKAMAEKYGLKYRHIAAAEMAREKAGHHARVCYYDGIGEFDWSAVPGLPAGFVVSRKDMDSKYALVEAATAAGIAFGDHGLGDHLTAENPFIFIAIGDPNGLSREELEKELASVENKWGDRLQISGFVSP